MTATDPSLAEIQQKNFMRARHLRNLLIAHIEGKPVALNDYLVLRDYFLRHPVLAEQVPEVVRQNSDLAQVWQFLKYRCSHNDRRTFLVDTFAKLLDQLREGANVPVHEARGSDVLLSAESISRQWFKIERDSATLKQRLEEMDKLIDQVTRTVLQHLSADQEHIDALLPARLEYIRQSVLNQAPGYATDLNLDEALSQCRRQLLAFSKHKLMLGARPDPARKPLVDFAVSQAATGLLQLNTLVELCQYADTESIA